MILLGETTKTLTLLDGVTMDASRESLWVDVRSCAHLFFQVTTAGPTNTHTGSILFQVAALSTIVTPITAETFIVTAAGLLSHGEDIITGAPYAKVSFVRTGGAVDELLTVLLHCKA